MLAICHLPIQVGSPAFGAHYRVPAHSPALQQHSLLSAEQNHIFSFSSFSYEYDWRFLFFTTLLTEKKIPSALLIIQPFPFLCLPSPGQPLRKLWILHYFFASVHPELPRADLLRIYCSLTGKFFFNSLGYSPLQ